MEETRDTKKDVLFTSIEKANIIMARAQFVEYYCLDKGWDKDGLSFEQIMEIRQQPGWVNGDRKT